MSDLKANRRVVFQGLGSLGVAAALAGCGSDNGSGASDVGAESGAALLATGDVPVGGGVILTDEQIVVTQPSEGEFKAFTAVCTHQACLVSDVSDAAITCACHSSTYDVATGEVTGGPAPAALAEVAITVDEDQITTA